MVPRALSETFCSRVPASRWRTATVILLCTIRFKHLAVSKDLIEAGADLEARPGGFMVDGIYGTPLHVAATKGFYQGMVALIDAGANVDSRLDDGAAPLFLAAKDGRLEAVRVLLRANANPLLSAYGSLPLGTAVYNGHLKVVRELVQRVGIDGCACDGGALVLAAAASRNYVNIVAFLCDAGVVDTEGVALCAAVEGCSEVCVNLLLERQGGNTNTSTRAYVNMAHGSLPSAYDEYVFQETPLVSTFKLETFHAPRFARFLKPVQTRHRMFGFRATVMRGRRRRSSAARPWT